MDNQLRGIVAAARLRAAMNGRSTSETVTRAILGSRWLREAKAEAWDEGAAASAENWAREIWADGEPIRNPYRDRTEETA